MTTIKPGEVPNDWEGLYKSAQEIKDIRQAVFPILERNKQGFISMAIRPNILELQKALDISAAKQFGLLGRLALCQENPQKCGTDLLPLPSMVLAFAIHSAILNAGFVCTGSNDQDFSETEMWPNVLPPGWLDDTGSKFSFRYRPRSAAADKIIWKGVVLSDLLAISANDPYSAGKDAMTMHLRIKDFVSSKAGEVPKLFPSKEKELSGIVEDRIIPIAGVKATRNESLPEGASSLQVPSRRTSTIPLGMLPNPMPEFQRDIAPGVGGSMFFGPGNPEFDARFNPGVSNPRPGQGRIPEARFDPYSPFGSRGGEPDPDHLPMPGRRENFPPGPTGPRREFQDYL